MTAGRTIFPQLKLFKKTVREHFLISLRETFKQHPAFTYDDDMSVTKIHIQPSYADVQQTSKNPRLLVKVGEYAFSLQDTLFGNMSQDIPNEAGILAGYQSRKVITTAVTVSVKAYAEEESSDLADELNLLAVYAAKGMFLQMGLVINGATVSETREADPANDIYETIVIFQVDVPWAFQNASPNEVQEPGIDVEVPDAQNSDYRFPGVSVYRQDTLFE